MRALDALAEDSGSGLTWWLITRLHDRGSDPVLSSTGSAYGAHAGKTPTHTKETDL